MKQNRQYDIFISYRRLDEQGNISGRDQARLIAKQLELDGYHPFFDYSEIKDNEFDKVIIPAVENSRVFILVLTKDALNRCRNEDDWVRREIETAIKSGSKVINVSPDNSFNGWPDTMPKSLYGIKNIQISDIHFGSLFELSIKKLIEERIVPGLQSGKPQIIIQSPLIAEEDSDFVDSMDEINGELNAEELYQKGLAFFYGRGVDKDKITAVTYYEKAARLNHPKAQVLLYSCCFYGNGIKKNIEKAVYWLEKAANNQEFFAMHTFAEMCRKSENYEQAYKYYISIVDECERLYKKNNLPAKESEHNKIIKYYLSSIVNIGKLYENGFFFKKDYEQAKVWYRKAKDLGNQKPMAELLDKIKAEANEGLVDELPDMLSYDEKYELAKRYLLGIGLEKSFEKALPLLIECAQNGIYLAYKDLGLCYTKGVALKRCEWGYDSIDIDCKLNYFIGYQYLIEYAKKSDDGVVFYELGLLSELGLGVQQDFSNALSWYKKAIQANYAEAVDHIANIFRYGKIRGEFNKRNYIICIAYSKVISFTSSQNWWSELKKENPEMDDFFKPRFCTSSPYHYTYTDDLILELQQYWIKVLEKDGILFNLDDESTNDINEQHNLENVILLHWQNVENRIRKDFFNIINGLLPEDVSTSYSLDSLDRGIEAVDLGLPSGALWGSINVYEEQTEPLGSLFAWSENKSKDSFTWKNYFDRFDDNKNEFEHRFIDSDMDAARKNFGHYWTVPTRGLMQELIDECHWEWKCEEGKEGYIVVGKNGNSMFLPVINSKKNYGGYWSSSINKKSSRYADFLYFDKENVRIKAAQRYMGLMIRPVAVINNAGDKLLSKYHSFEHFLESLVCKLPL